MPPHGRLAVGSSISVLGSSTWLMGRDEVARSAERQADLGLDGCYDVSANGLLRSRQSASGRPRPAVQAGGPANRLTPPAPGGPSRPGAPDGCRSRRAAPSSRLALLDQAPWPRAWQPEACSGLCASGLVAWAGSGLSSWRLGPNGSLAGDVGSRKGLRSPRDSLRGRTGVHRRMHIFTSGMHDE